MKKSILIILLFVMVGCTVSYIAVKKSSGVNVGSEPTLDLKSDSGIHVEKDSIGKRIDTTRNNFN